MFKTFAVAGAAILGLAVTAQAQVNLTAETASPGSAPGVSVISLSEVAAKYNVADIQVTTGQTLTNSVQNVAEGVIGATSQQYPLDMARLGIEAIAKYAEDQTLPETSPGLDFFNTGVSLITDSPAEGVESITSEEGLALCWG